MDRPVAPMSRATDSLEEAADLVGRTELHYMVDDPDIDPELEGRGRDQGSKLPVAKRALRLLAHLAGEGTVVDRDREVRGEEVEAGREPLRRGARIDEDEGRPVGVRFLLHGPEPATERASALRSRSISGASGVDSSGAQRAVSTRSLGSRAVLTEIVRGAGERKRATSSGLPTVAESPNPTDGATGPGVQSLERETELGASVGADQFVDLVHDDRANVPESLTEPLAHEQDLERLRGREQQVGRGARLRQAGRGRAVAVTDRGRQSDVLHEGHEPVLEVAIERAQSG